MRTTINHIGKYELKAVLARTPMSTVYDGWDSDIARRVAIKLMPLASMDNSEAGEAFARFKRGAQAAGQLNHPNIVGVYDYGETEDYAYLVMEFVNGSTLKGMFDDNQRFALADICQIIGSILEALQYSHDHGVVHRDVKPANIMFTKENQVKITDFGIARLEDSEMTQAGMVIGTPAYMSPEQFLGEKIDLRTDIYSTGVVLYHLLTGERPYEGNLTTIMHKVLYGSPLSPSRVSTLVTPALDAVVTRAMARNREDRFKSAAEFNDALQAARRPGYAPRPAQAAPAKPASDQPAWGIPRSASRSPSSPRMLGIGALIAGVVVVGGILGWHFLSGPASQTVAPATNTEAARQAEATRQAEAARQEEAARQQQQDARQAEAAREEEAARQQQQDARQAEAARQEEAARQQQQAARQTELARQEEAARQQQQAARQADAAALRQQEMVRQQQQAAARQAQAEATARQQDAARQQQAARQAEATARQQEATRQQPPLAPHQDEPARPADAPQTRYAVTSISAGVGLVCQSVTGENAGKYGLDSAQGMVVKGVTIGSAASKAGIRQGDVILKIKGAEANNLSVLSRIAADTPAGQTVPIDIFRDGGHQLLQLQVDDLRR